MMSTRRPALIACALAAACSRTLGGASDDRDDGGALGAAAPPQLDASASDAIAPQSAIRFAHLAPSSDVDFCYRKIGTDELVGPVFGASDAGAADAGSDVALDASASRGGLARFAVSGYLPVLGTGVFRVNVVAGGSLSCASPIASGDVTLEAGRYATVIFAGRRVRPDAGADGGATDQLEGIVLGFTDDLSVASDKARARFVNVALGDDPARAVPALSVTVAGIEGTSELAARVEARKVSTTGTTPLVDGRGYVTTSPLIDPVSLQLREIADAGGRSWSTQQARLGMLAGTLHSGFIASEGEDLRVVWCDDVAVGRTTSCDVLSAE
jgi:hypothetical protein